MTIPNEQDPISLHEKCETCAFRPGTQANNHPSTLLKARLCAMTGEYFLCHEHNPDIGVSHLQPVLCRGWLDLFENNLHSGRVQDGWQRDISLAITEVICDAEADPVRYRSEDAVNALIKSKIDAAIASSEAK